MKKGIHLVILLVFSGFGIQAQNDFAKNGLYLELIGNGGLYSINYERFLASDFSVRVGFGSYSSETWWDSLWSNEETTITAVPILGNFFYGNGNNRLELGAGVLLGTQKVKNSWVEERNGTSTIFNLTAVVGYRYQNPTGGFIFRAGVTPFIALKGGEDAFPGEGLTLSGGLSVGYAF